MRVNNVGSAVNFGKVIRVESVTNENIHFRQRKVDDSSFEVAKVLNSIPSDVYKKKEQQQIRDFFKNNIDDYNGKRGVLLKRSEGDLYLVTGKDTYDIKQMEKALQKKREEIDADIDMDEKLQKIERLNTFLALNKELKERAQGSDEITFSSSQVAPKGYLFSKTPPSGKIDKIEYSFYSDGRQYSELNM